MNPEERILVGADELFSRFGLKNVTMDDIAKHLSMSKKTIYIYFSDKNALVLAWAKEELSKHTRMCDEVANSSANAVEELMKLMQYLGKVFSRLNPNLFYDMQKYYPKAWTIYKEFKTQSATHQIIRNLEKGQAEGLYRADMNDKIIARMRMEQVEMAFNSTSFPSDQFSFADVQLQLFDHFMHGICTIKGHKLIIKYRQKKEK